MSRKSGFTLFEMVIVLVLLGTLAAVAVVRYSDTIVADELALVNTLKAHLRYAQIRAMGDTTPWRIVLSGNTYTLQRRNADVWAIAPINLPGEASPSASIKPYELPPQMVIFQGGTGRPLDINEVPVTALQSITIDSGPAITIAPETGFIP